MDQIAAPVLQDPPSQATFEAVLTNVLQSGDSPRARKGAQAVLSRTAEILERRARNVAVDDLPTLFLRPEVFPGSHAILERHGAATSTMRDSIKHLVDRVRSN
ncbi:MAG: hypothetical protein QM756_35200 [Polyangiaceae bacterium]